MHLCYVCDVSCSVQKLFRFRSASTQRFNSSQVNAKQQNSRSVEEPLLNSDEDILSNNNKNVENVQDSLRHARLMSYKCYFSALIHV